MFAEWFAAWEGLAGHQPWWDSVAVVALFIVWGLYLKARRRL